MVLFLAITSRQQAVAQKIKNFFTKWREVQQKIPLPEMTELLITPQLPEYPKIAEDVFMLLLDGKLRSRTERLNFLKPLAPPPPPPPPPPRRGRGKAAAAAAAQAQAPAQTPGKGKKKGKGEPAPAAVQPIVPTKPAAKTPEPAKTAAKAAAKPAPQKPEPKKEKAAKPPAKKPAPKLAKAAKKKH